MSCQHFQLIGKKKEKASKLGKKTYVVNWVKKKLSIYLITKIISQKETQCFH